MYIPKSMKNKIASAFYDKKIFLLGSEDTIDEEGGVISNSKEIKSTAIIGIADESTEKWLRQKVINMNHATENLLKIAVYCEEVRQATEESLADNAEINSKP